MIFRLGAFGLSEVRSQTLDTKFCVDQCNISSYEKLIGDWKKL